MQYLLLIATTVISSLFYSSVDVNADKVIEKRYRDTIPVVLPSSFIDDYGIRYTINDSIWVQHSSTQYHILRWNKEKQYLIARNDMNNKSDQGLYTRIDYMKFEGMAPYTWGFCLTTYNATTDSLAEFGPHKTDRQNPRKGCNGFPFSRMKVVP